MSKSRFCGYGDIRIGCCMDIQNDGYMSVNEDVTQCYIQCKVVGDIKSGWPVLTCQSAHLYLFRSD